MITIIISHSFVISRALIYRLSHGLFHIRSTICSRSWHISQKAGRLEG